MVNLVGSSLLLLGGLSDGLPLPGGDTAAPVLVGVGCAAALAIPRMVVRQADVSESEAERCLRTLLDAEANFMKADYDNDGKDFAFDLALLHDQPDASGRPIALIPENLSRGVMGAFRFGVVPTYDAAGGKDPKFGFAYYAVPKTYGKGGRLTCIVNHIGVVWRKDTKGVPPAAWPKDPEAEGWEALLEE